MEKLANAIIDKLKTSSLSNGKNIILFSDEDIFPEAPYVVVKLESGTIARSRSIRIIVHHKQGQSDKLNDYTLRELDNLLLGGIDDDEGSRYILKANGYTDITPSSTDDSYFMERFYLLPLPIGF